MAEELKVLATEEAARRGYASVDEYVADLIRGDAGRQSDPELETKLVSRLDQGDSIEMTAEDWGRIREEFGRRMVQGPGK